MKFKLTLVALMLTVTGTVMGQTTGTQKFTVTVPSAISITPPPAVNLTHDQTENEQVFPNQNWIVKGNSLAGVTASFSTATAFRHTVDATARRNARLALAVSSSVGSAAWTVSQPTDVTDYANNDGIATVQVTSNGFGRANLGLGVSFVTDGFGSFPSGDYETIVTGTVTAN